MKIVAIGDIHGKDIWKKIIEKEKDADKIIFLGDYLDSSDIGVKKQVKNFIDLLDFKKENPEKVTLLFGNHDFHYLPMAFSRQETYSGFRNTLYKSINVRMNTSVINNTLQMCYRHENILFSHAGITKTWCEDSNIDLENIEHSINSLFKKDIHPFKFHNFNPNGKSMSISDPYGDNVYQSPTWVRPVSLLRDKLDGYIQVVGHTKTRFSGVQSFKDVFFTDCLDLSEGYLVIEGTEFIPALL